jgi:hypothetical protein
MIIGIDINISNPVTQHNIETISHGLHQLYARAAKIAPTAKWKQTREIRETSVSFTLTPERIYG